VPPPGGKCICPKARKLTSPTFHEMVTRKTKGSFEVSKFPLQWTCCRQTGEVNQLTTQWVHRCSLLFSARLSEEKKGMATSAAVGSRPKYRTSHDYSERFCLAHAPRFSLPCPKAQEPVSVPLLRPRGIIRLSVLGMTSITAPSLLNIAFRLNHTTRTAAATKKNVSWGWASGQIGLMS